MRRRNHLLMVALMSLALVPSAALAQASFPTPIEFAFEEARGGFTVKLPQKVTLQPLTAAELLAGTPATIDMGAWMPGADPGGSIAIGSAVRTIQELWEARVNGEVGSLDVQIEIVGEDGTPNALNHDSIPNQFIDIAVTPTPTIINVRNNRTILVGGVELGLDLSQAGSSGNYEGRLIVTVSQL